MLTFDFFHDFHKVRIDTDILLDDFGSDENLRTPARGISFIGIRRLRSENRYPHLRVSVARLTLTIASNIRTMQRVCFRRRYLQFTTIVCIHWEIVARWFFLECVQCLSRGRVPQWLTFVQLLEPRSGRMSFGLEGKFRRFDIYTKLSDDYKVRGWPSQLAAQ